RDVEAVRTTLAQAQALQRAGKLKQGIELVRPFVEKAQDLGYRPLQAEVYLRLGHLQATFGEDKEAERNLKRATWAADASYHDEVRVEAATHLTEIFSSDMARVAMGHEWFEHGLAVLSRMRHPDAAAAQLHLSHVQALIAEGDYAEAEKGLRKVMAL